MQIRSYTKIVSSILFLSFIFQISGITYASDLQDQEDVRTRVLQLQQVDANLPWGVAEQKWKVGTILAKLFDANGKVKQIFLHEIFDGLTWWELVYYDDANKRFMSSVIRGTNSAVWIWGWILASYIANFTWDVNITWDLDVGGNITASAPTANNHVATKDYVDSNSGLWTRKSDDEIYYDTNFVGIGNTNPWANLSVTDITSSYTQPKLIVWRREAEAFKMYVSDNDGILSYEQDETGATSHDFRFDIKSASTVDSEYNFQFNGTTEMSISENGTVNFTGNQLVWIADPATGWAAMDRDYADNRFINVWEAINGDTISDNTIDSSEIQNNTITASDLAPNSVGTSEVTDNSLTASDLAANAVGSSELANNAVTWAKITDETITAADIGANAIWNSELIDNPTVSSLTITGTPSSASDAATKSYVDTLVQGLVWKEPNSNNQTCNSSREWWATYNTTTNIVYVCNGSSWVDIWSTASVPYATTTTAWRLQLSWVLWGTWNNVTLDDNSINSAKVQDNTLTASDLANGSVNSAEIVDGSVRTQEILDNTITETDISDSFVARAATKINAHAPYNWIGDLNASPRSMHSTGISLWLVRSTSPNFAPIAYGSLVNFPSYTTGQDGWAGQILFPYDLSYTGNGNPMFRTWDYNNAWWSAWKTFLDKDWADSSYIGIWDAIPWDTIVDGTIDSSEIQNNTLTANDLAANSVGNSELIDTPTITQLNVAPWNNNGLRFWSSDQYEISMGNTASTHRYGPVTDYSIKTNMSNTAGRWFTWWVSGLTPTVAFEAQSGDAQFAGDVNMKNIQVRNTTWRSLLSLWNPSAIWDNDSNADIYLYWEYNGVVDQATISKYSGNMWIDAWAGSIQLYSPTQVLEGRTFQIHNSSNTDYVRFQHDGTDLNITDANTTDINISWMWLTVNGQDVVTNPNRTLTQKADIGSGVNLNSMTITGLYHQNSNASASSGSNYPVDLAWMLQVVEDGNMVYQTYHVYGNNNEIHSRWRYNGTWSPWNNLSDGLSEWYWQVDGSANGWGSAGDDLKFEWNNADVRLYSWSDCSTCKADVEFFKSTGNSDSNKQIVGWSDMMWGIRFYGYDGDEYIGTAWIFAQVDGTPGNDSIPTKMIFTVAGENEDVLYTNWNDSAVKMTLDNDWYLWVWVLNPSYRLELPNSSWTAWRGRANAWHTYSSRRWKENIEPIQWALQDVQKLQGITYNWKVEQWGKADIGFIAEEVWAVFPEMVEWEENQVDAKWLAYDRITAVLVEAVKELFTLFKTDAQETDTEIESLKSELEELKETVRFLESQIEK